MLALLAAAAAHSPHDVAGFVALGDDGVVLSADTELLAWSTDGGASFTFRYLAETQVFCGVAWDAEHFAAATLEDGVWASGDGGVTLEPVDGPIAPTACARGGESRYIGGADGVWAATAPDAWVALAPLPGPVRDLAADGDRLVVLLANGTLFERAGSEWTAIPHAPEYPGVVALDGDAIVVAGVDAGVYRYDGAWTEVEGAPLAAVNLAIEGDTWLAATAGEGVWASEDGGGSWALYAEGFEELATGPGSPTDGVHFLDLAIHDGTWWSAQWEGLWWRSPGEDRWRQAAIDTTPRVRAVAGLSDGTALVGAYGGGVYRGTPGELDWRLVSGNIGSPYPKQILTVDDATWLVVSNASLFSTRDAGATWARAEIAADEVGNQVAVGGETWLAAARLGEAAAVARSTDAGATWSVEELPGSCAEKPTAIVYDGDVAWIVCGGFGDLFRSDDDGVTWAHTGTAGTHALDLLAGEPLLLATAAGVLSTEDGVSFTTVALADRAVDRLVRAPDGTLWAAVADAGVGRVEGGSFVASGWPTLDHISALAVAPDGRVLAGGRSGAYGSADGVSFAPLTGFDWADDAVQRWWFGPGWSTVEDDAFAGGRAQIAGEGAEAELGFVGEQVRIRAVAESGAAFTVRVDGGEAEEIRVPRESKGLTEVWAADVPPGPHRVAITVVTGRVAIDGAVIWRTPGPPLPEEPVAEPPPEDCGCAAGGGGAAGALALLALVISTSRTTRRWWWSPPRA